MEKNTNFTVGIFSDEDILINAVKKIRAEGVRIHEVYTPYPVHFLEDALGYKRSIMPRVAFGFGALGCGLAILMQTWMMGIDWPMIIGGKSFVAIPDFVPVTFEMTVLLSAFGMGFTFFVMRGLLPHSVPRVFDRRSTDDKHVMAIDLATNKVAEEDINGLLRELGAEEVFRKDFDEESEKKRAFFPYLQDLFTNGVTSSSRSLHR
jgi:hypothetical protein